MRPDWALGFRRRCPSCERVPPRSRMRAVCSSSPGGGSRSTRQRWSASPSMRRRRSFGAAPREPSHEAVRDPRRVEASAPVRALGMPTSRLAMTSTTRSRCASRPAFVASAGSSASSSRRRARARTPPLRVAAHRDHERSVRGREQFVRHEIRMRVPPALRAPRRSRARSAPRSPAPRCARRRAT